jgi:adenylate cyclase
MERRLAAVLAADVAGYSRLMGLDEEGTLARLKAARKALVDPTIAAHRGRIVKTTGDGMLVEFASAVDAVRCAIEVQDGMAGQSADGLPDTRIEFRIGIHVGDIIFDDNDIFGDGVNIAARLEGIAEPGGVCISDDTYRQVRDRVDIAFDDKGETALKNIARPVRVFALAGAKQPATKVIEPAPPLTLPDKPSIAVLPFQNMSGDPEQEYFADGMVEDIITALSRFKSLFVIARNSSFTYKDKAVDIKQVGRELGVRYVLEGSVRKAGSRIRITGQLIDAGNGAHIWADKFDGALDDLFELQDSITSSVVGAIAPKLQISEFERIRQKPTDSLSAYDFYLRGLAKLYQFKQAPLEEARPFFQKSIEIDPHFAAPYAASAFRYGVRQTFGWGVITSEERTEVVQLCRRAVELENDDATVLSYAGFLLSFAAGQLDDSAALLERAVEANPNAAVAWTYRGFNNILLGNHSTALKDFGRSLRLSPLDPIAFATKIGPAQAHFFLGHYAEASRCAAEAIVARPDFLSSHVWAGACNAMAGNLEAARRSIEIVKRIDPARRVSTTFQRYPLRREEDLKRFMEGLRLAGLPE